MQLHVNPRHPEPRKIQRAVQVLRRDGVVAYPTDTIYGLGCDIYSKKAIGRLLRVKGLDDDSLLSFVCPDLSDIARYGIVHDAAYRIMKRLIPGPYTFILQATREVPRIMRMRRKTVGIRVPDHPVALSLARELGNPLASTSATIDGEALIDPDEIERHFPVDLLLDADGAGLTPSTILDLSGEAVAVVREGAGPVDFL